MSRLYDHPKPEHGELVHWDTIIKVFLAAVGVYILHIFAVAVIG